MNTMVTTNQNLEYIHKNYKERNTNIPPKKIIKPQGKILRRKERRTTTKTTRKQVTK